MRHTSRAVFVLGFLLTFAWMAQAAEDNPKSGKDEKNTPAKSDLVTVNRFQAEIAKVEKDRITLRTTRIIMQPGRMNRGRPSPPRPKQVSSEEAFSLAPGAPIRTLILPPKVGDNGKAAAYTAAEKKQFKGDHPELPGYEAKASDLFPGTMVEVLLGESKEDLRDKDRDDEIFIKMIVIMGINPNAKGRR